MRWKHTECCIGIEHWNVLSLCAVIYESKVKICRHTTSHLYSCAKFLAVCQFVECKVLCSNCVCQICVKIRDGNWLECKHAVHAKFSTARSCYCVVLNVDIKEQKLRFSMLYCCTKSQERAKQHNLGWNVENEQILWAVGSQRKVKPMCVPLYLFNTSPCVGLNTSPCVCVGLNWVESVQSAPPFVAGTHRSEWSRWNWKGCWQSSKRNQGGGKSGFDEISSCKKFGSIR